MEEGGVGGVVRGLRTVRGLRREGGRFTGGGEERVLCGGG